MAVKLVQQVGVIFILLGIGIFIKKKGMVTLEGARQFSNFSLVIVTPTLLVNTFQRDFDPKQLIALGVSLLLAVAFHVMAVLLNKLFLRRRNDNQYPIEQLAAVCSNCGFMGIPLMMAVMGEETMLYAAIYIGIFNIYIWSHGKMVIQKASFVSWREVIKAPGTIGALLGVGLFLLQIRLPTVARDAMQFIASMNTPLPTVITGVFIADISLKKALINRRVYYTSFLRLVLYPLIFLAIIWALRIPQWFDGGYTVALAALISCSCPGAVSLIMMPAKFGGDTEYGANIIAVSSALSIITIPAIATLAQWLLI